MDSVFSKCVLIGAVFISQLNHMLNHPELLHLLLQFHCLPGIPCEPAKSLHLVEDRTAEGITLDEHIFGDAHSSLFALRTVAACIWFGKSYSNKYIQYSVWMSMRVQHTSCVQKKWSICIPSPEPGCNCRTAKAVQLLSCGLVLHHSLLLLFVSLFWDPAKLMNISNQGVTITKIFSSTYIFHCWTVCLK